MPTAFRRPSRSTTLHDANARAVTNNDVRLHRQNAVGWANTTSQGSRNCRDADPRPRASSTLHGYHLGSQGPTAQVKGVDDWGIESLTIVDLAE